MNDTLIVRCILVAAMLSLVMMAAGFAQKKFQEDVFKTSGGELKITLIGHGTLMFSYAGKVS
jgi:TRAP-type C4-dicarboxylate transport system substrate-binding protein